MNELDPQEEILLVADRLEDMSFQILTYEQELETLADHLRNMVRLQKKQSIEKLRIDDLGKDSTIKSRASTKNR